MVDSSSSRTHDDRNGGNGANGGNGVATAPSLVGLFRNWLRGSLRGKPEATWRETIEELIEEPAEADDAAHDHERELVSNILRLKTLTAVDVMVPRADIVAVDVATPLDELTRRLSDRPHSRIPVYRDSLDEPIGMVHIKDVLAATGRTEPVTLADLVREVLVVAPSMAVPDLLIEMREKRRHMALVVDEFGGIDGLVTIEDVVEEIVGDIDDEHDDLADPEMHRQPDGTYLADARFDLEDFEAEVGAILDEEEREDLDTLGGLVSSLAGRVPARGEVLKHESGFEFEVTDSDPRRVRQLRVRPPEGWQQLPRPEAAAAED